MEKCKLTSLVLCFSLSCACAYEEGALGEETSEETVAGSEQAATSTYAAAMSLNVRIPVDSGENTWAERQPRLANLIAFWKPALLGLQELRSASLSGLYNAATAASGQPFWYYWIDRGDGEILSIFVDTAVYSVLNYGFRNVTNSQRDDSCGLTDDEDPVNRPIQYVKVQDRLTNKKLYFYNTHWPSKNSCERRGMANIFASYIAGRDDTTLPVVAVGDFNDGYNADGSVNSSVSSFLSQTGLRSTYAATHTMGSANEYLTGNSWNKTARVGKMIDHVMASPSLGIHSSYVDRYMFDANDNRIWCAGVTSGGLCSGTSYSAANLALYSDHWGVVTRLYR